MSTPMPTLAQTMTAKLTEAFAPQQLEIIDDSHRHVGHAGHDGRGESHFHVIIVAEAFAGQSRVARQRAVYQVLSAELADRVHALQLTLRTPQEAAASAGR